MKIAIIGTGAYGIAMSLMLNENNKNIVMYTKFEEELKTLRKYRANPALLPGVKIPGNITFTNDMKECVENSDIIFIMVPAGFVDDVSRELANYYNKQIICIGSKGIEQDTCLFVADVVRKYIETDKIAVLSGPSFAIDMASYVPIGLTLATENKKIGKIVKKSLENNYLKIRVCDDIVGTEICGSIKNIIAIASGIIEGLDLPESTRAMLLTESMHDIKELINVLGGNKKTILSYAGIGDLILTCSSDKSRNYTFGKMLGERKSKSEIEKYLSETTVEGFYTLKSIYNLLRNKKVKMPIIDLMYDIIIHGEDVDKLKKFLVEKE